jgi:hypothetical protein
MQGVTPAQLYMKLYVKDKMDKLKALFKMQPTLNALDNLKNNNICMACVSAMLNNVVIVIKTGEKISK